MHNFSRLRMVSSYDEDTEPQRRMCCRVLPVSTAENGKGMMVITWIMYEKTLINTETRTRRKKKTKKNKEGQGEKRIGIFLCS